MAFRVSSTHQTFQKYNRSCKPTVYVNNWFGRLGNNIIQIINALHIAICLKTNVYLSSHSFFKENSIVINKEVPHSKYNCIIDSGYFFYQSTQNQEYFRKNYDEVRLRLKSIFTIDTDTLDYDKNENNLLIHIRGGDIIIPNKGQPDYPLPPISFYDYIIQSKDWENIKIISEDKNWIVDTLLNKYPKCTFKIQSLYDDILEILRSKNIIISVGTFIPALIVLANNQKNVYKISNLNFQNLEPYFSHNYIQFNLDDYFKTAGKWSNTHSQLELVKTYQFKNCS